MKPVEAKVARTSLGKKNFYKVDTHHEVFYFYVGGKKTTWRVKISHGAKEMKQREIKASAFQCEMSGNDMHGVLSCEKDHEWLLKKYLERYGRVGS